MRSTVVAFLLLALPAAAAPSADPATARAKELFTHAESLYALMRYAEALPEYEKAFESKPLPGLLFNIGQCHKNLGHYEKAIHFYRTYLEKEPDARNRAVVASLITETEKLRAKSPDPVKPPDPTKPGDPVKPPDPVKPAKPNADPLTPPPPDPAITPLVPPTPDQPKVDLNPPPPPVDTGPPLYRRWYFLTGVAVVAVLFIALGVGFGVAGSLPPQGSLSTIDARK